MSLKIDINSQLNQAVCCVNFAANALTNLYYYSLNTHWTLVRKMSASAFFHYDLKVTLYNVTTACIAIRAVNTLRGTHQPLRSLWVICSCALLRVTLGKSLLVTPNLMSVITEWSQPSELGAFNTNLVQEQGWAACYVGLAKIQAQSNKKWKENMLEVHRFPILKNWTILPLEGLNICTAWFRQWLQERS